MTELRIYPSLTSSRPGLYDYFAGYRTIEGYAASGKRILSVIRDIQRGRWWSLDKHVKIIRHGKNRPLIKESQSC